MTTKKQLQSDLDYFQREAYNYEQKCTIYLLVIIFISFVVGLIIIISLYNTNFFEKTKFIITKEECTLNNFDDYYETKTGEMLFTVGDYDSIMLEGKTYYRKERAVKSCEQVEVDTAVLDVYSSDCVSHSPDKEWAKQYCKYTKPKEDLTKEWLNENADRCSIYLPQEGIELWTDQNKINQINGRTCSKWQLGEYTIEVKQ